MIGLTNIDITAKSHHISYFRGVFSQDALPNKINKKECDYINYDSSGVPRTHWTCYVNDPKYMLVEFFESCTIRPGDEIVHFLKTSNRPIAYHFIQI